MPYNPNKVIGASAKNANKEWVSWVLYSGVLSTASAVNQMNWFQDSISTVGRARTNMEMASQLASGKYFLVEGISFKLFNLDGTMFQFSAITEHKVNQLMAGLYFDFMINSKVEYEGMGIQFHEQVNRVLGLNTTPAASAAAPTQYDKFKTIKLHYPIEIMPQTNFKITGATGTLPAAADGYVAAQTCFMFMLHGKLRRIS
jgi:hypothetical protein